jgi:hypothetical protein
MPLAIALRVGRYLLLYSLLLALRRRGATGPCLPTRRGEVRTGFVFLAI